jgi:hypothetical protein
MDGVIYSDPQGNTGNQNGGNIQWDAGVTHNPEKDDNSRYDWDGCKYA